MDAITTATITVDPFRYKIICTAIGVAIVLDNLAGTKQIECSCKPEHIKDSKDSIWHHWKDYECLNFSYDLCSNLHTD